MSLVYSQTFRALHTRVHVRVCLPHRAQNVITHVKGHAPNMAKHGPVYILVLSTEISKIRAMYTIIRYDQTKHYDILGYHIHVWLFSIYNYCTVGSCML